jgi:hypothetical protein
MAGRRLFLKTIGGLTLIGAGTASYGLWFEPGWRLSVAEYRPRLPNWPASTPLTIAALSDIHANEPYMPLSRLAEIVEATNALNPDLVVLLGDYPGNGHWVKPIPVAETAQVLRGLRARHGVHTVLGEHDWWDDVQVQRNRRGLPRLARTLAEQGRLSVLHNAAVKTGFRGQGFWVAGCGSLWAFREGAGPDAGRILAPAPDIAAGKRELERFLFTRVYRCERVLAVRLPAQQRLRQLFDWYCARPEELPRGFRGRAELFGARRSTADYLAGMTDRYLELDHRRSLGTG